MFWERWLSYIDSCIVSNLVVFSLNLLVAVTGIVLTPNMWKNSLPNTKSMYESTVKNRQELKNIYVLCIAYTHGLNDKMCGS